MRIIHTVLATSKEASGPFCSVDRLCKSLMTKGGDVTLVTLDWAPMDSPPMFLKRLLLDYFLLALFNECFSILRNLGYPPLLLSYF
jgi:hypothetical protein